MKSDPSRIMVAAITGPVMPYAIALQPPRNRLGVTENQPQVLPTCTKSTGESARPAVRIQQWVEAFANRGLAQTICANTFASALQVVATELSASVRQCVTRALRDADPSTPALDLDCRVTDRSSTGQTSVPACASNGGARPCWRIGDGQGCDPDPAFFVTRAISPPSDLVTTVSCASCPPGFVGAGCP